MIHPLGYPVKGEALNILFATSDLKKRCHDPRLGQRVWGGPRVKLLGRRLDQIRAATNLAGLLSTPGRPHPLHGNGQGKFTIDLDGPYRLVFEPADNPLPLDPTTNSLKYEQVTSVCILGVEDTHE